MPRWALPFCVCVRFLEYLLCESGGISFIRISADVRKSCLMCCCPCLTILPPLPCNAACLLCNIVYCRSFRVPLYNGLSGSFSSSQLDPTTEYGTPPPSRIHDQAAHSPPPRGLFLFSLTALCLAEFAAHSILPVNHYVHFVIIVTFVCLYDNNWRNINCCSNF